MSKPGSSPPEGDIRNQWCKFDDDVVSRATKKEAITANFGGERPELPQMTSTSAYMLVYIRESCIEEVLMVNNPVEVPPALKDLLEIEKIQEAQKRKDRMEAEHQVHIRVVSEECMSGHEGAGLMDVNEADRIGRLFRISKTNNLADLYRAVGESFKLKPCEEFRLWLFQLNERCNVYLPSKLLLQHLESSIRVKEPSSTSSEQPPAIVEEFEGSELLEVCLSNGVNHVFIETVHDRTLYLPPLANTVNSTLSFVTQKKLNPISEQDDILIFVKYLDVQERKISFCGHLIAKLNQNIAAFKAELCSRSQIPAGSSLLFFTEVNWRVQDVTNKSVEDAFNNEVDDTIEDGAVLIFQKTSSYNAIDYFWEKYLEADLEFIDLDVQDSSAHAGNENVIVRGSFLWPCSNIVQALAQQINWDQDQILLFLPNLINGEITGDPIGLKLMQKPIFYILPPNSPILNRSSQNSNCPLVFKISFKKLPFKLMELDERETLPLMYMDAKLKLSTLTVYPKKVATVASILEEVSVHPHVVNSFSQKNDQGVHLYRLVLLFYSNTTSKIRCIVDPKSSIRELLQEVQQLSALRIEEVPSDQYHLDPKTEVLLPVAHFYNEGATFGIPFFIKVRQGELYSSVVSRLRKMLPMPEKEFQSIKFAFMKDDSIVFYLDLQEDSQVIITDLDFSSECAIRAIAENREMRCWLGLEHVNKFRSFHRSHVPEKAIVIRN